MHRDDDFEYRGARIPRSFWKVVALADPSNDRRLISYAYLIDQYQIVKGELHALPTPTQYDSDQFRVTVSMIESITPLRFGVIKDFDAGRADLSH